ncbi:MAG: L,D-transpeptidase [Gammaproteobacteria bacterium]|nr:L,D-transpeptidase [Gammaproteobacteria bacterium]MBU1655069.1 L,D-transpeptidase [Gammaproteobacteria bacterium]MBU1961768.1 L,D-transpeptidase [Gammaproteobacteria bacterium]
MIPGFHRLALLVLAGWVLSIPVAEARYGEEICNNRGFKCLVVKKGQTWRSLFPRVQERDLVQRLNRMNSRLLTGMIIAVPKKFSAITLKDIAPFPATIEPADHTRVFVNQRELAWGAYDWSGRLVKWGPMSGGQSYCADIKEPCETPSGQFTVFRKEGADCISKTFPIDEGGGAEMPYCTFFNNGVAFHGSAEVPGYHASHGCVRMFAEDARWLNIEFVELGKTRVMVDSGLPSSGQSSNSFFGTGVSNRKGGIPEFPWH